MNTQDLKSLTEARNKVSTSHTLNIKGRVFELSGKHEFAFRVNSSMYFTLYLINGSGKSGKQLRGGYGKEKISAIIDQLLKEDAESQERKIYHLRFNNLSLTEIMNHEDFRYGRLVFSGLGNYYNIYFSDKYSPTGVSLIRGCTESEFEETAKNTGNSHNYLVGNEGRRVA